MLPEARIGDATFLFDGFVGGRDNTADAVRYLHAKRANRPVVYTAIVRMIPKQTRGKAAIQHIRQSRISQKWQPAKFRGSLTGEVARTPLCELQ
jgi:ribosomal protein L13